MNTRRQFLVTFGLAALSAAHPSLAQQPPKVWRIGFLSHVRRKDFMEIGQAALLQGLRDLGYVEGKNLIIEWRFGDDKIERLPELAAELVSLKVDLIVAWATPAALAAKRSTSSVSIVIVGISDPVGSGIVASLGRPGGNVTGLSAKQVELLVEIVPRIKRLAVLRNPANSAMDVQLKEVEAAARSMGLQLQVVDVRAPGELESAFASMIKARAMGMVVLPDSMYLGMRQQFADLAKKNRLPVVFARGEHVEAGGLLSYGPRLADFFIRTASYVDKILKGAKPADLPVEQPTKIELKVNLKTAKAIGVTFPNTILLRADRVIE